jgi:hypothetical protein
MSVVTLLLKASGGLAAGAQFDIVRSSTLLSAARPCPTAYRA